MPHMLVVELEVTRRLDSMRLTQVRTLRFSLTFPNHVVQTFSRTSDCLLSHAWTQGPLNNMMYPLMVG